MVLIAMVALGAIDIEQNHKVRRRRQIQQFRKEIEPHGFALHVGGSLKQPWYCLHHDGVHVSATGNLARLAQHILWRTNQDMAS